MLRKALEFILAQGQDLGEEERRSYIIARPINLESEGQGFCPFLRKQLLWGGPYYRNIVSVWASFEPEF